MTLRDAVLALLREGYVLSADHIANVLKRDILSIRPRVSELHTMGLIEKTGGRRQNRSGRTANIWRAKRRR